MLTRFPDNGEVEDRASSMAEAEDIRYAVVTGGNKGIGFAICKQLASEGIVVVLTARDEKRGLEATKKLQDSGFKDRVIFHHLDVTDPASIAALEDFIKSKLGKLDILVNNAGVFGTKSDPYAFGAAMDKTAETGSRFNVDWSEVLEPETYEMTVECVTTNYYGVQRMCNTFLPLLHMSNSPRIVNISSSFGQLQEVTNKWAKEVLGDHENLTEEKVDEVLKQYLKDFKEGLLSQKDWPSVFSAYIISKAALNAYTRIVAKKWAGICINALCPGFVKTDLNYNTGVLTPEEGAACAVRLALLPNGSTSGFFYFKMEKAQF